MRIERDASGLVAFVLLSALFAAGFAVLAVRLREVQVSRAAEYRRDMDSQSYRRVQTAGLRGRILDRHGVPLAENRLSRRIVVAPEAYRAKTRGETTEARLAGALASLAAIVGRAPAVDEAAIRRHLRLELARPLVAWRDVTDEELARFAEHSAGYPGFECVAGAERSYPQGTVAAHLVGRVGRDRQSADAPGVKVNFVDTELCGREGLELQYDDYLRGMPGDERVMVDARGYATARITAVAPHSGLDLTLTIDLGLQRAAERQLAGLRGACVAIDPRDGAVRALASAPAFDPNECVPVLRTAVYNRLANDPAKPLLCRATAGTYAPGSTFKPVTALAGLATGHSAADVYECIGYYQIGEMKIRCSRTWGHGGMDLAHALKESCNPYFCALGMSSGSNAVIRAAREFGLGERTGIDFPTDAAGVVPDAEWKARYFYDPKWRPGDLAQMSMGQGQLLATPLQMARVAAAIGSGRLVTPRLNAALPPQSRPLAFPPDHLRAVRRGMAMVVDGGTGRLAGEGVDAFVIGKTGTAQVGAGQNRRKNTWFIAYATPTAASRTAEPLAVALVVEDGESGGGTAAPIVAEVLKAYYNSNSEEAPAI